MNKRKHPVMVVVYTGGPRGYSLRVDETIVGADDLLGIEDAVEREEPHGILGLMVRAGADRGKATWFLRNFKRKQDERRAGGSPIEHQSGLFHPGDWP